MISDKAARPLQLRTLEQMLDDPDALKPPTAIIPRLAWEGRLVLLSGREKLSGKSTLLTAGAAAVTDAVMFPETQEEQRQFLGEPVAPGSVLWVSSDQEADADIAARAVRFHAHASGFHVLWPGSEPLRDLEAAWHRLHMPNLVVTASTSDQWGELMQPLLRLARLGVAVVVLHHATKSTGEYRDSTAIAASVDQVISLKPVPDHPTWRRVESIGRLGRDTFTVALEDDDYRLVSTVEVAAESDGGRKRQALREALGTGDRSAQEVSTAIGCDRSWAKRLLDGDPGVTSRLAQTAEGQTRLYRLATAGAHDEPF